VGRLPSLIICRSQFPSPSADPSLIPVDIIVPVFRGFSQTRACIESVLAAKNARPTEIVVMDDASPEAEIGAYLTALAEEGRITLIENAVNLGFVATCNRAMELHPERDIVLLNSDTLVADHWLDRMVTCAETTPLVASVTPFSNNATICSYPRIAVSNELVPGLTVAELDVLFCRVNAGRYVEIPTAVGFCMFVKRTAISAVGLFDVDAFGRGYGEENDWCMRAAKQGFSHLLCGDVFVYHQGEVSFGGDSLAGKQQAQSVIDARYPQYRELISRHIADDPARILRRRVDLARLAASTRPLAFFITHNFGDGTERYVEANLALLSDDLEILVLQPDDEHSLSMRWTRSTEEFDADFEDLKDPHELMPLLRTIGVSRVHLHHLDSQIATARNQIAVAEAQLAEGRHRIEDLNHELTVARSAIDAIQVRLEGERDAARAAFALIISSTAWRVTGPVRRVVEWLRRKIRKDDLP